jgi:trimeric autotransporter adhesin
MKNSRRRDWQTLVRLIMRSSILGLRPLSLKGVWQAAYVILLVTGALAHAQVIETVAGGASGSAQPSQNVCVPIRAAAAHGTDIYVVSCNRIYKVDVQSTWTLVAGNGVFAFSGDGGPATSASLGQPESIALDTAGNLYILDTLNWRVREVFAATGLIETIAGNGVVGYNGDGPALASQISGRGGLSVDTQGNVFLADADNGRIREITNGGIQTVAGTGGFGFSGDGGPATSAQLFAPRGVFVDVSGNIFIADTFNHRVREVVGGIIHTIAGNGIGGFAGDGGPATSAELYYPYGVFADSLGNILIADTGNDLLREVTAGNGTIKTLAGNGLANPSSCNTSFDQCIGDGGPATRGILRYPESVFEDTLGNIFALALVDEIQEIPAGTTNIQTFAGNSASGFAGDGGPAPNAQLSSPVDAVSDMAGNLYIADTGAVREVFAATGMIQTIAGKGIGGIVSLSGDNGPAASATTYPNGFFVDAFGNLFIADGFNEVREISAGTGTIRSVAGNGIAGYTGDGGPATNAELNFPNSVFVDAAGNIFIADSNNSVIREVIGGPGGNIVTVAGNGTAGFSGDGGPATSAQLAYPSGVYVDASGNIFIADGNNRIREVLAATHIIQTVAGNGHNGYNVENIPAITATLNGTTGVFGDTLGNIYVPDFINNSIRAFTVGGNIHTVVGNRVQGFGGDGGAAANAELNSPTAIFVTPSGELVITDTSNYRVRIVGPATTGTATNTTISASLNTSVGGQAVTFTAAVTSTAGGAPTGAVSFLDNGTQVGTGAVSNGLAIFSTSSLSVGSHSISAQYSGNSIFAASTSASTNETVNAAEFGPSPATMPTVAVGQSVTFALTMFAAPGSNLTFTMSCSGLPANSSCTFTPNPFAPGPPPSGSQVQITFSTQAPSASVLIPQPPMATPGFLGLLGFAGLLTGIGSLFAWRKPKPSRRLAWGTAAVVVLAATIFGCGGGGGSSPGGTLSGGTPRGIANITVTATSGSTTMMKTVAVNVQ